MDSSSPAADGSTALLSPAINLWRALEARQIDPAPMFRAAGVDPATLGVPGRRMHERTAQRLTQAAETGRKRPRPRHRRRAADARNRFACARLRVACERHARGGISPARPVHARGDRDVVAAPRGERRGVRDHLGVPAANETRRPDWLYDWLAAGAVRSQPPDLRRVVRAARGRARPRAAARRRTVRRVVPRPDRVARAAGESAVLERGLVAPAPDRQPRGRGGDRARRARLPGAARPRTTRSRRCRQRIRDSLPVGRAVAGRGRARPRAEPAHARPTARAGGDELHRARR